MGSVRFDGEDESQPSTSDGKKYKSSKKLIHDCGAVNYASIPKKLRSDTKKRVRESISLPCPISRKQRRVSNGVEKLRENGAKKSRVIMKQGLITKDEEEVAETLNALADMFSDMAKTNKCVLDDELSTIKSSTIVEAWNSITAVEDSVIPQVQEESRKMNTEVTLDAACHSSEKVENFLSLDDAEQPDSDFSKQSDAPSVSGAQSYLNLGPSLKMFDMNRSCKRINVEDQVSASDIQYGKYHCTKDAKYEGLSMSPNLSSLGVLSSETLESRPGSSANRFPGWSENIYRATKPSAFNNSFTADRIGHQEVVLELKKSWKKCSAHVCIARLIKVLQKRETSNLLKPTSGGVEQWLHASSDSQKRVINGTHGVLPFKGVTQSTVEKDVADTAKGNLSHKSLGQDHQHASKTPVTCSSLKPNSDFLTLAAGGCGSDTREGINRAGYELKALKQFNGSHHHPKNHSAIHFPLPQNGYSSTFHGRTSADAALQLPPYLMGQKLESWTAQFQTKYNPAGVATPQLSDWQNYGRDSASSLNNAQALFPRLHSVVSSKYQHFSPPQLQLMPINSSLALSNLERHHHRLNPAFERNGAALYSDNMRLLCNQYL